MKKFIHILTVLLIAAACQESDREPLPQEKTVCAKITGHGAFGYLPEGIEVGAFVVADGIPVSDNVRLTALSGGVLHDAAADGPYLPQTGCQVSAYAPWQPNWNNAADLVEFVIYSDQRPSQYLSASDLMIASPATVTDGRTVLNLEHKFAKILVHVVDKTGEMDNSSVSMTLNDLCVGSYVHLESNTLTLDEDRISDVMMNVVENNTLRVTLAAVVPPQVVRVNAGKPWMQLDMTGSIYSYPLEADLSLEGGKVYTFVLRKTQYSLVLDGCQITDWTSEENNTGLVLDPVTSVSE